MNKTNFLNIRIDDKEKEIIQKKMESTGLGQAAVVRLIIREWAEMKKEYITIPKVGKITQDGTVKFNWDTPEGMKEAAERG